MNCIRHRKAFTWMKRKQSKRKQSVVYKAVSCGVRVLPLDFAAMLAVDLLIAVIPVWGIKISRDIYQIIEQAGSTAGVTGKLIFPLGLYSAYLAVMKLYTIFYKRVYVQFYSLLKFEKKIKLIFHEKCSRIGMFHYENPQFYNKLWEAKVASINIFRIIECMISFLTVVFSIVLMGGYVAGFNIWFLALIVLSAVPALTEKLIEGIADNKSRGRITRYEKEEKEKRQCILDPKFYGEVRIYREYSFLKEKWKEAFRKLLEEEGRRDKFILKVKALMGLFRTCASVGTYFLSIYLFYQGEIDYSIFMSSLMAALYMQSQYTELFEGAGIFSEFILMVKPFFTFMEIPDQTALEAWSENITLKNVSFGYPSQKKMALKNIDLEIKKGETIAIVGVNGAGKSTLAKLILGMLPPAGGSFSMEHRQKEPEIQGFDYCDVSAVFQDFCRYELTLEENIDLTGTHREEKLSSLVSELGLQEAAQEKDRILGKEFGRGDLSGGQWQKTAIARCLYKDAEFYILDEPTSAIDPLFEKKLNDMILHFAKGKTMVVISHRLSLSRRTDRVVLLSGGQIIEQGSHDSLLERESLYKKLWTAQKDWYENSRQ